MSRRKPLKEWLLEWIDAEYPAASFNRPDALQRSYQAVPRGYLPSVDKLIHQWWTKTVNSILSRAGFGFPEGEQGDAIVRQLELPWAQEQALLVGRLVMAKEDIDAVRADLETWATMNNPSMNIDATMADLKMAAGL